MDARPLVGDPHQTDPSTIEMRSVPTHSLMMALFVLGAVSASVFGSIGKGLTRRLGPAKSFVTRVIGQRQSQQPVNAVVEVAPQQQQQQQQYWQQGTVPSRLVGSAQSSQPLRPQRPMVRPQYSATVPQQQPVMQAPPRPSYVIQEPLYEASGTSVQPVVVQLSGSPSAEAPPQTQGQDEDQLQLLQPQPLASEQYPPEYIQPPRPPVAEQYSPEYIQPQQPRPSGRRPLPPQPRPQILPRAVLVRTQQRPSSLQATTGPIQ